MANSDFSFYVNLNTISAKKLMSAYNFERESAWALVKGRPYMRFENILENDALLKVISVKELFFIMASSASSFPNYKVLPFIDKTIVKSTGKFTFGEKKYLDNSKRIYIEDDKGNEIISAELTKTNEINLATIWLLNLSPYELIKTHPKFNQIIGDYFRNLNHSDIKNIWEQKLTDDKYILKNVSILSQIVFYLVGFITPHYKKNLKSKKCETNGCTSSPDFNFKDCCDQHDICYCIGGDEEDRLACDDRLFECIKKKGHPILAAIYRAFVEALGSSHFNYNTNIPTVEGSPDITIIPDPPQEETKSHCSVKVYLVQVYYGGDNIGNDMTYKVIVEGETTKILDGTHNRGATRGYNKLVYDKKLQNRCNTNFSILLSANVKERDSIFDDHGSKSVRENLSCTNQFQIYNQDLEVKVKELKWYGFAHNIARLRFSFRIETICE